MTTVGNVTRAVGALAPWRLAEPWDNVGLLLGDPDRPVRRVLVSLDVSEAVADEAAEIEADLLLAHHPLIFKGLSSVTTDCRAGELLLRLAEEGRAVVAAHTNLDSAEDGLCDQLAAQVGLEPLGPLRAETESKHYKVVVFTPEDAVAKVRDAAFEAGAGRIGQYAGCSFATEGVGTFTPSEAADPAVGEKARPNSVPEQRLEMVVSCGGLARVVGAIARTHPYEEPAVDIYTLRSMPIGAGLGRVGRLPEPRPAHQLADRLASVLGGSVGLGGDPGRPVQRVALVTGAGGGLLDSVIAAGADAYITGELKLHEIQDLEAAGISVMLGGHYETERVPLEAWAPLLAEAVDADVVLSERERPPLAWR